MLNIIQGAVSLGLLWAIMTLGVFLTYRILDYADLTVEGSITMGAAIAARLISDGIDPVLATAAAIAGGMAAGWVTGFLHTRLKIPGLLSGILSMIALYSINIRIMGKANLTLLKSDTVFTGASALGLSSQGAVMLVGAVLTAAVIFFLYWFFGTELGCAVRATGDNEKMARAQGINTDTMKLLGLMLSNGLVAFSGALIAQNQRYADITMGQGAIVIGLASVIIGEVLFDRGGFLRRFFSMALGAVVYRIIIAFVIELGMQPTDLRLFTAITVAAALSIPNFQGKARSLLKSRSVPVSHAPYTVSNR